MEIKFRSPIVVHSVILDRLRHNWRWRKFLIQNAKLRSQGFIYAITPHTGAYCHRLHKVGCYNLLPKKAVIRPLYFKTYREVEEARGNRIDDKDLLECQSCFERTTN